ncbi:hypothetical protein H6F47_01230 [Sphaerospermopsis sp. FACHB-1094]|uniref:Uncharacterized protein n=1 Tax=Sphaerospermopsis reniformis TaxID=531300 RepID=A0A480A2X8_9CYAN|nr:MULTISPECIES: hypothetical protein [Sphaerospermopsis]MBD2131119.1 hypothetical protein [Sphaerospermopsis sp. FACHB-1094]GCL39390.1 hypothetical protein SR1949_45160 [Sphaerospermopsis reniformis]
MAIHLLPFIGKVTLGVGKVTVGFFTAYITIKGCEAAAKKANKILDEHYPQVKFRLNATIVDWGVKLVQSTVSSMVAEDKKGEVKKQIDNLTTDALFELIYRLIKDSFNGGNAPNGTDSKDSSEEETIIEAIAYGAYSYFMEQTA